MDNKNNIDFILNSESRLRDYSSPKTPKKHQRINSPQFQIRSYYPNNYNNNSENNNINKNNNNVKRNNNKSIAEIFPVEIVKKLVLINNDNIYCNVCFKNNSNARTYKKLRYVYDHIRNTHADQLKLVQDKLGNNNIINKEDIDNISQCQPNLKQKQKYPGHLIRRLIIWNGDTYLCSQCNEKYFVKNLNTIFIHIRKNHSDLLDELRLTQPDSTLQEEEIFCDHIGCFKVMTKSNCNVHYRQIHHFGQPQNEKDLCKRCKRIYAKGVN
ncbi:hypothetical protein DICPUDRAFT_146877 [Dictyostelium purpureum]|uniref:Uncharacterized protein n=1 Tax=Dictyostelium purpureum TaxID=5786 RepID=F0Z744_DICPU|nr:uncharacterized protein DICPUDRAFT_146877 [Dictyostelium purpureum]EGC40274.1 hypothetical protein DICPUDRAFT_146877 [Dictyostelium purpureum]|eukprot:XP_003283210.1 hypothetical protein DICPUDRAFT_146877 [Dictyostelium purpureum]